MDYDRSMLLRAIKIAADGISNGTGPFGAIIAKEGKIKYYGLRQINASESN